MGIPNSDLLFRLCPLIFKQQLPNFGSFLVDINLIGLLPQWSHKNETHHKEFKERKWRCFLLCQTLLSYRADFCTSFRNIRQAGLIRAGKSQRQHYVVRLLQNGFILRVKNLSNSLFCFARGVWTTQSPFSSNNWADFGILASSKQSSQHFSSLNGSRYMELLVSLHHNWCLSHLKQRIKTCTL